MQSPGTPRFITLAVVSSILPFFFCSKHKHFQVLETFALPGAYIFGKFGEPRRLTKPLPGLPWLSLLWNRQIHSAFQAIQAIYIHRHSQLGIQQRLCSALGSTGWTSLPVFWWFDSAVPKVGSLTDITASCCLHTDSWLMWPVQEFW